MMSPYWGSIPGVSGLHAVSCEYKVTPCNNDGASQHLAAHAPSTARPGTLRAIGLEIVVGLPLICPPSQIPMGFRTIGEEFHNGRFLLSFALICPDIDSAQAQFRRELHSVARCALSLKS